MSCRRTEMDLVGYCFAALDDEARAELERHLLECRDCVGRFVTVKRELECTERTPAPSRACRERLREAVSRELEGRRAWWERPLAVAIAATLVLVAGGAMRALTSLPAAPPHALRAEL